MKDSTEITVFQFLLDPRVGGPHVRIRTVADKLDGISTRIVTCGRGEVTDLAILNLRSLWRPLYALEVLLNSILILFRFWKICRRQKVIFHVNGAANLAPIIAARGLGVPVVWHFNDTLGSFRLLSRLGFRFIKGDRSRIVVSATSVMEVYGLAEATLLFAPVDTVFWERGGHAPPTDEPGRNNEVGLPAGGEGANRHDSPNCQSAPPTGEPGFSVLNVANMNPLKAQDLTLDALGFLPDDFSVRFIGEELSTFRAYVAGLHAHSQSSRANFLGRIGREEVRRELATCDVFILPSRSEACPVALLEAMAMECPCVASDVGGVREILGDGAGIIVPAEDADALADALLQMRGMSGEQRSILGRHARERVLASFSVEAVVEKHGEIYRSLIQG